MRRIASMSSSICTALRSACGVSPAISSGRPSTIPIACLVREGFVLDRCALAISVTSFG
jgi:hypothetical protein